MHFCFLLLPQLSIVMTISESTSVCKALDILVNASKDDLEPHWSKAREIFEKLRKQMRTKTKKPERTLTTTKSSTVTGEVERTSSPPNVMTSTKDLHSICTSLTQPQDTSGPSAQSENQAVSVHSPLVRSEVVQTLVEKFAIEELRTFVNAAKPTRERFQSKGPTIDVRITDISSIEGRRRGDDVCMFDRLRRGLGAWSLASDYESWRLCHPPPLCAQKGRRYKDPTSPENYIKLKEERFGLEHQGTLRYAIRRGRVLLDYEQRLKGRGYLAILIFYWNDCLGLKTKDKDELVDALQSNNGISKFAQDSKGWVDQWRHIYDGESPTFPCQCILTSLQSIVQRQIVP